MELIELNSKYREIINSTLEEAMRLPSTPEPLRGAMRYSIDAGGKRIRPCLTLGVCNMLKGNAQMAIRLACGIEMIHTYSLIHDDMPCMDDDDMRRGRPSNHKVFGEGQALLAGDALLTYAFEWMLSFEPAFSEPNYFRAVAEIAKRAGVTGMAAGQSADLKNASGGAWDEATLNYIHRHKTGDMLTAAVLAGAYCAKTGETELNALESYSERIGLLFQIKDDILDAEGDEALVGKTLGKDSRQNKLTFVSFYGLERAKELAAKAASEAEELITKAFGEDCRYLRDTIYCILNRNN